MEESAWADIAIVSLISISTFIGLYRGLIREALTLATWIFAAFVAVYAGQGVGDVLGVSNSANINYWVGAAIVFFGIVFIGYAIKIFICKILKISGVKPIDRVAGAIFGALRGAVVVVLVLVVGADVLNTQTWYKESTMVSRFKVFADIVLANMPNDWRKELEDDVHDIQKTIHIPGHSNNSDTHTKKSQ